MNDLGNSQLENRSRFSLALFVIYLLALSWLILLKLQFSIPVMDEGRVLNLIPLLGSLDENGVVRLSEIRANVLAFIPLGIYICLLKDSWSPAKKILAIVGLTLVFETIQFIFAIGRADITDVLSNTLGGIIGIGSYALLSRVLKDRANVVVNALAAAFTVLALLLILLLLVSNRWVRIG